MSNVPLPEPDISVPFLSEVRKVPQGDYYRADKVLPLLKQWSVLYEAAKAGHEQAFAEAQNAAAVSAAKDAEIAGLRAELFAHQVYIRVLCKAVDAATDFAGTVAGGASWWDDVWAEHFRALDAARATLGQKP